MSAWSIVGTAIIAVTAYLLLSGFFRTWRRFRGVRVITCPENREPAAVEVDALRAARWAAMAGETDLHLSACSRWPEKAGCAQECLAQIESSPESCLVRAVAASFYSGKHCIFCNSAIEQIVWLERPPALRAPDKTTHEWKDIAPQDLPKVFATYEPVCWPCHIRESFRAQHPDLVIERPRVAEPHPMLTPSSGVY